MLLFSSIGLSNTSEDEKHKLDQDPTKIITKFGISYAENFSLTGSFAFDQVRKVNIRFDENFDEWRAGGSWLFNFGIVNINLGRKEFDDGGSQTNYSIGTFVPLSKFGITPWDIQIFPRAGYTYNDGEIPCNSKNDSACKNLDPESDSEFTLTSYESHSAYLGVFSLKKLSDHWTAIAILNGSVGSNDYSGFMIGGGVGYQITQRQSVNLMGVYIDNSYGEDSKGIISYSYQFN